MDQLITEPNRVTHSSLTLIDHRHTTCPIHLRQSGVIHVGIIDHHIVYVIDKYAAGQQSQKQHVTISHSDFKKFSPAA